ncbi:MAG: TetR/AcrR family transcriptional regulator [Nitrososphaerota archaeon]
MSFQQLASEKILDVASKLFAQKGYSNVSVREICKEAGTTPPMIYYYYGSKRGLFDAVRRDRISLREFVKQLASSLTINEARESLSKFVKMYLDNFPEDAFELGLYIDDKEPLSKENTKRILNYFTQIHKIATSIITKGVKSGEFNESNPEVSADLLIGLLNHFVFRRIHFSKNFDTSKTASYITDFFLRAMR